ncbi:DUF885 domain-containing protein [Actinophytocola xanthii]|uniref:DUF885 domain-containing protein n=1 Tax=Actinophytocola xanthii TaxID=1912961 RepID=A0A1Q8CRV5_9PSEU|nr:DUF885 domain-containing protein [Actinophytocola xanthii]OLF17054.1 hypothetical protein BU204_13230 [Actinophytocola xanthii]
MADTVNALADEYLELTFTADPLWATLLGLPGHDDALPDRSAEGEAAFRAGCLDIAARAEALDASTLDRDGSVTRSMLVQQARSTVDQLDSHQVEYGISNLFVSPAPELLALFPMLVLSDEDRTRAYLQRLRAVPGYLRTVAGRHREGLAAGRVPVARLVRSAVAHLDRYLAAPVEEDPAARQPLEGELAAERGRLLADVVRPAFAEYRAALSELVEHGRDEERVGLCWLPDGEAMYAGLVRHHTTTDRTPEELHQTGLELIERLTEEYARIGERVFGTSDQQEVFRRMTTDPAMRWHDAEELLASAREAVARAEAELPRWFGRLAQAECKIEPVPAADAPGSPAAFYLAPSVDGARPGTYFANTYRAEERDRFTSEVMAFHEVVPGHHFQIALAQELTHLPMFRRVVTPTAYAEGWGLYTERLADEMGVYSSDLMRLGMLATDSMRAGRLVVDTGMHALGWSRERAVAYLRENTPMADLEIGDEIDRYIVYPGQALSYMVGRLELQRLRGLAEQRLGSGFDIRAFHDTVLGNGSLPLSVLDEVVGAWLAG